MYTYIPLCVLEQAKAAERRPKPRMIVTARLAAAKTIASCTSGVNPAPGSGVGEGRQLREEDCSCRGVTLTSVENGCTPTSVVNGCIIQVTEKKKID